MSILKIRPEKGGKQMVICTSGNAIIVTFGNYPLMTKYTPSYRCKYYKFGKMNMESIRSHMFRPEEVFYSTAERNRIVLGNRS